MKLYINIWYNKFISPIINTLLYLSFLFIVNDQIVKFNVLYMLDKLEKKINNFQVYFSWYS